MNNGNHPPSGAPDMGGGQPFDGQQPPFPGGQEQAFQSAGAHPGMPPNGGPYGPAMGYGMSAGPGMGFGPQFAPGMAGPSSPLHYGPMPGMAGPFGPHAGFAPQPGPAPQGMGGAPGGQNTPPHSHGMHQLFSEISNGGNPISSLSKLLDFSDGDFWKGAAVGAALVLLLTNEDLKKAIFGAKAGAEPEETEEAAS